MPESHPSQTRAAVLRISRTLVYDDHADEGGNPPDIDPDAMRIVLDYGSRAPASQPVVRSYAVTVAVPSDHPRSWEVHLGDDYELLITTRGFAADAVDTKAIKIDGRVVSNYQIQFDEDRAPVGPNAWGFGAQAVGERVVVQVLNDEAPGRIFREFEEIVIEQLTDDPPELAMVGIDESAEAQERRRQAWTPIRKRSLR